MSFRLLCLRHGRTAWNAAGRFQGQSDIPLDEVGQAQARETAAHIAKFDIHHAIASDLVRAAETARIVLGTREVQLTLDPGLRERHFGLWEGLTWAEIVAKQPELADETIMNARVFEPPEGERFADTTTRVVQAFERLKSRVLPGETALLVAHAGALHALLDGLFGPERESFMITPASIIAMDVHPHEVRLNARDSFSPNHT